MQIKINTLFAILQINVRHASTCNNFKENYNFYHSSTIKKLTYFSATIMVDKQQNIQQKFKPQIMFSFKKFSVLRILLYLIVCFWSFR